MTSLLLLSWFSLALAVPPAWLFVRNLRPYRPPPHMNPGAPRPRVSVLIPARNESRSIEGAVASALASEGVDVEVLVLDDHSEDETPALVRRLASRDERVRVLEGPELPAGWCGKPHACQVLAREAGHELLLFLDADVRLLPDGLARLAGFLEASGADLVSGVPCQETVTLLERLVVPLIHFVLLGFLPLRRMRTSRAPIYGAGCGQLFLARRPSYERAGGHTAVRASMHDGVTLPRAFRAAGLRTDLCDATDVARCRMYRGAGELWRGFAKNAGEGLGSPRLIVPVTLVLLIGQVLPEGFLALSLLWCPAAILPSAAATLCSFLPRCFGVARFRQPWLGALLHPLGIMVLLLIQWHAFWLRSWNQSLRWKGRAYPASASSLT